MRKIKCIKSIKGQKWNTNYFKGFTYQVGKYSYTLKDGREIVEVFWLDGNSDFILLEDFKASFSRLDDMK